MITYKNYGAILCVGLCAWRLVACSANTGQGTGGGMLANSGGSGSILPPTGGASGSHGGAPIGAAGVTSGTGSSGGMMFTIRDSGTTVRTHDSSCGAVAEVPEQITVYKEASVTDTTYTYTPVALFIMLDRSSSMVQVAPGQSTTSWSKAVDAVTSFVNDPKSAGLDIGLGSFPVGQNNTYDCNAGMDCGTPVVPIASLPNNAMPMINAMTAQTPTGLAFTPTECALRGMINECLQFQSMSPTGEKCVAVLVTDGTPTQCTLDETMLAQIITDGHAKGVDTYTLGLPGSDINVLNQYAQAGGTMTAVDVSAGADAFVAALQAIRGKVAHPESHVVVTSHVIQTPLKCQWKIPAQKMGDPALDPEKVNLQYTPMNGPATQFGHVASAAACPASGEAWYFDDEMNPTQIFLCPSTCTAVENVMGARIDILLHCPRIEAKPA
ncbi:MAG TPA: vWA domain-containing protein [Polyangiaceae bacterium]|jgi:uncharacterized protein YegL|nr:vWA domain-containing protein [Polyangiaceae bacterium]